MAAVYDLNTLIRLADPPAEAQEAPLDTLMMTTVMQRQVRQLIVVRPRTEPLRPSLTRAERDAVIWEDAEWQ